MGTRLCAVSFKPCWRDSTGRWYTSGGFSLQMAAIASLFDAMTLLITEIEQPGSGGMALPETAQVVPMPWPKGFGWQRKLSFLSHLPEYLSSISHHARRADCVHVPLPGDISLLGMLVALGLRKRLIVRWCGSWFPEQPTTWLNRWTRWAMRRFAGGRNIMLATGEGRVRPAPGVHWIFASGLSEKELREIRVVEERALSRPPKVAYLGRLSPEKGVAELIEAVSVLEREGFDPLPQVTLAGDGPQRPQLERQVRSLGLAGLVKFAGQVDREALGRLLSGMDFCVQPSLTEGYSKAWLDAFAYGLPVLGTRAGAAEHVIGSAGERGWLAEPGDVEMLARAIRDVISEPGDWPGLRRRCRSFVEGRTLEAWAREIGRICAEQWEGRVSEGKLLWGARTGAPAVAVAGSREFPHS